MNIFFDLLQYKLSEYPMIILNIVLIKKFNGIINKYKNVLYTTLKPDLIP